MVFELISNNYFRAFAIFIAIFLLLKSMMLILGKVIPRITSKTQTNLDDLIIRRSSVPLIIIAFLFGLKFAIYELGISNFIQGLSIQILNAGMILVGGILVYFILDSLIVVGFKEYGAKSKGKINESLVQFFHSILMIGVFITAFLFMLSSFGVQIGPLLAGLGVAGIAIAFALQSTLSNIFGGISLLLDRSINVGDVIQLPDGVSGKILKINLRSTKIKTFDNELIIVPNSKLSEGIIQNIALPEPKTRVVVPFGVAYGSEIEKVKRIVLKEIRSIEYFVDDPEPSVKFISMGDSSLNFKAYFYIKTYDDKLSALDVANTLIYNALNKAKIEIPYPKMDVYLKK